MKLILHTEADLPKACRYCDEVNERQRTTTMRVEKAVEKEGEKEGDNGDEVYLILLEV